MARPRVTGYAITVHFGQHPDQIVQFIGDGHQIGSVSFTDPTLFGGTVDMLRNEGPDIFRDDAHARLLFGLEPTGEEER